MNKETKAEVAEFAAGTCRSEHEIARVFNCDEDTVLEACDQNEVYRCRQCGWWCETHEIADGVCDDCAEE